MRSFAVAGPPPQHIWNSLPAALRTATLSPLAFARHLKTHLLDCSGLTARLRTIYSTVALVPPMSTMNVWRGIT